MGKNWLLQLPLILFFWFCFLITEGANRGTLDHGFLRDRVLSWVSRPPHVLTDLKFKVRGVEPLKNKLVVVEIDSNSISALGRWPWHRDTTAYLVDHIFQAGAKVVGLDMVFSEPDRRVPDGLAHLLKQKKMDDVIESFETDRHLERVIEKYSDRLVLGWISDTACQPKLDGIQNCPVGDPAALAEFPAEFERFAMKGVHLDSPFQAERVPVLSFVTPIANIDSYHRVASQIGFLNASLDSDGYIRRAPLIGFAAGRPYASLPFEMARVGQREEMALAFDQNLRVQSLLWAHSGKSIPVNQLGVLEVNFRGPSSTVTRISALDVMSDSDLVKSSTLTGSPRSKKDVLSDAYVLIGITALGVHDMRQFPFESNSPGVDGHIHILDNLLSNDPLVSGSQWGSSIWVSIFMLICGIGFAWALNRWDALPGVWLFVGTLAGFWIFDFTVLFKHNLNWNTAYLYFEWMSVFVVTLAIKYAVEERNKKFIRDAFSKYVAPAVVDSILKDPKKLSLGGEKREMTILFSDIRNFTSFSEQMDAKALASFLNDYLGIMTGIVFKHHGTLDKYIGDAVMAFWGAPLDQSKHAFQACQAAVEMIHALKKNQKRFKEQYGIDVEVGIGINSGLVNVGNMGSQQNFEYTVIGDHVNLASRVEGLTKKYGVRLLTTRFTWNVMTKYISEHPELSLSHEFSYRVLDDVKVKGKKQAVELIEILDQPLPQDTIQEFEEARQLYRNQKWNESIQALKAVSQKIAKALGKSPEFEDGPCETYLERCQKFLVSPPASDWDGSWEMESK